MTSNEEKSMKGLSKIRKMRKAMIIGYALIIILAVTGVTAFAVSENETVLTNKVSSMISSLNVQLRMNLESYLSKMESVGTMAFAVDDAYTYDASDKTNDEYESLNLEKSISDELYKLCLMENFVDYGIVYRNNRTVGKISNGTIQLFGSNIFSDFEKMISRKNTHDGWYTGYNNDFDRIYYVKRIHSNAILVISFYTNELDHVLDNPETLSDMSIRLTDSSYNIIYSSVKGEIGTVLPKEINNQIKDSGNATIMDNEYLTTVNSCDFGWYVVCSIPTDIIMKEKNQMRTYIYLASLIAIVIAVVAGSIFTAKLADPVALVASSMETNERQDDFEGVLIKQSFEAKAEKIVSSIPNGKRSAIVIADIDNFSIIKHNLGIKHANEKLETLLDCIHKSFPKTECIGRMGDDVFCIITRITDEDSLTFRKNLSKQCGELCSSFMDKAVLSNGSTINISVSVGAAIFPENGRNYKSIYEFADKALFASTANMNTYTVFDGI